MVAEQRSELPELAQTNILFIAQRAGSRPKGINILTQRRLTTIEHCYFQLFSLTCNMIPDPRQDIGCLLKKKYFWDVDISAGRTVPKRLIVERIFSFGTLAEMNLVIGYFGKEEVEKTLVNLNFLDSKTLNFVSKYFNRPKKDFRCYTRRRLTTQHWSY